MTTLLSCCFCALLQQQQMQLATSVQCSCRTIQLIQQETNLYPVVLC
jgi:hypothetical protein